MPRHRIDRRGLVGEVAERRPRHLRQDAGRVGLPDHPALVLLAREPGAPRRRAARAVQVRAGEDRIRGCRPRRPGRSGSRRCRRRATPGASEFWTRTKPPSSVLNVAWPSGEKCHGNAVPSTGVPPREICLLVKPGRELEAVRVRRKQLAVGPGARDGRRRQRLPQPRRREEQRGRAAEAGGEEVPAPEAICRRRWPTTCKTRRRAGLARASLPARREPAVAGGHRGVRQPGVPEPRARARAPERLRPRPQHVGRDLGAAQPRDRPPVPLLAPAVGDRVRGRERQPDRRAAPEQLARVVAGSVVAEDVQGLRRARAARRARARGRTRP